MVQAPLGNERVRHFLEQSMAGNLAHAFWLRGPRGVGKAALVEWLARCQWCTQSNAGQPCGRCTACVQVGGHSHPDLCWVARAEDAQRITIDQIRELKNFTHLTSWHGHQRLAVIDGVGDMNDEAANALLKVLEEPAAGVRLFLLDHETQRPLATLRSRCVDLYCGLVPAADVATWLVAKGAEPSQAQELAHEANGRPGKAKQLLDDESEQRARQEVASRFLAYWSTGDWSGLQVWLNGQLGGKGANLAASENRELATQWLTIWLEVSRDTIMYKAGLPALMRYQNLKTGVQLVSARVSLEGLLAASRALQGALRAISGNAQVRLAVEALALNLPTV